MLPWEHLAVGYILYSAYSRLHFKRPPAGDEAIILAFATQLPDLIDKPLAWSLDVLPSAHSLGHSLLFTLPLLAAVWAVTRKYGRSTLVAPLSVGYLSHLPADALTPPLFGLEPYFEFLLWPVVSGFSEADQSMVGHVSEYVIRYINRLLTPEGILFLLIEVSLLGLALAVWRYDGMPGLVEIRGIVPGRRRPAE